ncbi:MAG: hypothetical protein QME84_09990 [Actinomycetota bacterium]|nr:hypothetical protein [Actinomycetota bacterium]
MSWTMYRWVWQLKSPLHIGWLPAGALNRTRLYVPARALWGALTAELARRQNPDSPDYKSTGQRLLEHARFSYLFLAEPVAGEWKAWLPRYQEGKGLVWIREDGKTEDDCPFRMRLLSARPGTAIAPESDTAAEGTLREFEVIHPYWRDKGDPHKPVAMVGYLFCKDAALEEELKAIQEIFLGGDTRYGLGHVIQVNCFRTTSFFKGAPVDLSASEPVVQIEFSLAHTRMDGLSEVTGAMECIAGWDMVTGGLKEAKLTWAPGSRWPEERNCTIGEDGLWQT